mmetsp:Transcript_736/g.1068  ORF Transcript_736/g.1068 Transcript_736/m.1068 type:complete len:227 (-) Transcript_736:452-1132(-)
MASFQSLPDNTLSLLNEYFADPVDTARLAATCQQCHDVLPSERPLLLRLCGCHGTTLSVACPDAGNCDTFYVSRAHSKNGEDQSHVPLAASDRLAFGLHYYFWTVSNDGSRRLYLGRKERIGNDSPERPPHWSHRFNLGLSPWTAETQRPPQTWTVSHCAQQSFFGDGAPVPFDAALGLSVGGVNPDLAAPDNINRRVLTSRRDDWNVVVSWFGPDERTSLQVVVP